VSRRKGHGTGAGTPRDETKPWDEQRHPEPDRSDPLASGRASDGTVRTTAAAKALASLPRRGRYLPREIEAAEDFKPYELRRRDYLEGRAGELYRAWGPSSRGVLAMVYAESWLWAGSEYSNEKGARTGEIDHFKTAGTLAMQAKQLAAAAWELADRESTVRSHDDGPDPWETSK
jgi:hypothetical protein